MKTFTRAALAALALAALTSAPMAAFAQATPPVANPHAVSENLACAGSTIGDIFGGNFSTTIWPKWFQSLFHVKSLSVGDTVPCMAKGYVYP